MFLMMSDAMRFCKSWVVWCFSVVIFSIASVSMAHEGATGLVKERMDRFKASKTSLQAMRQALKQKDWRVLQTESGELSVWAREIPKYFPEGSNQPPSEARKAVWQDRDGFMAAVQAFRTSTDALKQTADESTIDGARLALRETAQSCKACHETFRKD